MSSQKTRHANCSVVGCKDQHKCLYSVPAKEEQKKQWLRFIFNDNVPATVRVSLYVCANHFTSDCFRNEGQYKAGFASTLTLVKGSVPTKRDPETSPEPQSPCTSTTGGLNNSGASIEVCVPDERDQPESAITPTPSSLSSEDEGVKDGCEKKIIVNESSLMSLFKFCQMCRKPCLSKTIFDSGAHRTVKWTCLGGHSGSWTSSPDVRGRPEGTEGSLCRVLPLHVKHVASQTDPPKRRNTGTQSRVSKRDCGMCTLTFPLDSPILFLQPTLVKRPSKRPRRSLTDKEEGPSQCCLSMEVNTGVQSDSVAI